MRPALENKACSLEKGRPDLVHFARVLLVVAYYELGEVAEAEKIIHATKISLRRHGKLNPFYSGLFQMFGQLFRVTDEDQKREVLQGFVGNFESGSPYWESSINYFNFRAWANALIQGDTMRDTLKAEFENQS